jgi:xylan 1,4-beta-xylosidase
VTQTSTHHSSDARTDWENRIGQRTDPTFGGDAPRLDPPAWVRAEAGGHQVTLTWAEVPGAVGYQVYAADSPHGDYEPLDHAGRDVLAVPHPPYADTTGTPGVERWYRVATLTDVHVEGELSEPIAATALADTSAPVVVGVDASSPVGELPRPWRPMIGSEHLSHALSTDTTGGRVIGEDLTSALAAARQELGVTHVRAHAILCDDVGAYREVDGEPVHDFTGVDKVYDHLRSLDLYPVVELSFMPHDLAADPTKTVFDYGAIVSPPKDWQRWHDLVRDLTAHLAERHGLEDLVEHWSFEVWNEANLEVFWSGTPAEYLKLYDVSAAAVKSVDPRLRVGGPSSAASGWVEELLSHADESGAPVDFLTTHTYGSPPLDFRPALERHGREGVPIWWTEWGVTPTHFNEVSDAVFAGTFLLRGMASAMRERRIEALSYWVVSDHFEELGRPPELLHGGFGLRTVGELRKPRWWALELLERLREEQVAVDLAGDGAGSLVEALAATDASGEVTVLTWNLTLDQTKASGAPELSRRVRVELSGLTPSTSYALRHERVDDDHSDIAAVWGRLRDDGQAWPTESQWAALREADRLDVLAPDEDLTSDADGSLVVEYDLPMPAMSLLTLTPSPAG